MTKRIKIFFSIVFTTAALVVFFLVLFRSVFYSATDEIPITTSVIKGSESNSDIGASSFGYPARLTIPKIKVDANVQRVGITKKGNMATPNNFTDVGWYKYGALPGGMGSAVVAGHVDNGIALPAVFNKLGDLAKGDDVYVSTENGKLLHFVVTGNKIYDFDAKVVEVFQQNDGRLLKLITCAGTWISKYKTHDKRLVVTAVLKE